MAVGATINQQPGLFAAAIMDVPFLDVLTTMSDASLPLVTKEQREWGDPTTDMVRMQTRVWLKRGSHPASFRS